LSLLARRAGLNLTTLRQLRELSARRPAEHELITASDVAEYLGVQERTARRVLKRLERSGIAEAVSAQRDGHSGRPRLLYRIRL
jgi:predicted ArsR family transcriptional regulator